MRVEVRGGMLQWARERAGLEVGDLARRLPKLQAWEDGTAQPTLKQLETFARSTHVPVGYLFLPEPPVETVPIPDFRTVGNVHRGRPGPDLLDTIYLCQQRQDWYREFARLQGEAALRFVGAATVEADVVQTAAEIRKALRMNLEERRGLPTWTEALRRLITQADELGVLVMVNGVVGSNTRRKLDPDEFRGFALADSLAPVVFVNGADTKAAQMFTLVHELAHIWLGETALSDAGPAAAPDSRVEQWCNRVAAEVLVPLKEFAREYDRQAELFGEARRLARVFKVSTLVVLGRMLDAGGLTTQQFWEAFHAERARLKAVPKGEGGSFYLTLPARVSRRFARALVVSTLEGQTLHSEAFRLLGFSKMQTFRELGHRLGVA